MPMELQFKKSNGPVDDAIDHLFRLVGDIHHSSIVREMILASLKAGQECMDRFDLKLMNSTLKEMRFTAKVFSPYRKTRKVSVFGSARTRPHEIVYSMARRLGRILAEAGYMVITGGGPGIMQAVNEGAGPKMSFGVNIRLPFEQRTNPILDGNPRSITYKYFFNRKVAFLKETDAVVVFPGGFGTLDEAMETLTLVQTGKREPLPILLIDEPAGTYWEHWTHFVEEELLTQSYISNTDFGLIEKLESEEEVCERLRNFYSRYHSLRYVGERLVLRLESPLDEVFVSKLQGEFVDLLTPGGRLLLTGPLPEEEDEPGLLELPRIVLDFNRKDFGRLKALIDSINSAP
jgi:uncharacterized protein (TIGR00730 family)